jgi:hypothetical protein
MPASAVDVIRPAFDHTVRQLFKPFRLGQWVRLAITGLLAGELGTPGGCSAQIPWRPPNRSDQLLAQAVIPRGGLWFAAIVLLVLLALVLVIALIYISSRMRFVLFDSVVAKECNIRRYWAQRSGPAFRYFAFQLLLIMAITSGVAFFASIAAIIAFLTGWLRNPRQHVIPLILVGTVFFLFIAAFLIIAFLVAVLTKDFVVPQMALEDLTVAEGWRRLWFRLMSEKGGFAGYVGMKIVLTIAATIAEGIAALIVVLALLIPIGFVALIVVLGARAIGIAWNVFTISVAIVAGCIVLAAVIFGVLLISVPVIVFFPAYSIYFFATRYPALSTVLYPPAPPPEPAGG